jgi:hypothetical protein
MILIFVQTGKSNNFFFLRSQYDFLFYNISDYVQISFFYKLFYLDRKWNAQFSKRIKKMNILKHLQYASDLSIDNVLKLKRINLIWNIIDNKMLWSTNLLISYIVSTKKQTTLIDFTKFSVILPKFRDNKKFFNTNQNKINLFFKNLHIFNGNYNLLNIDFRLWHIYCTDSYSF